jgi:hypothetical protein
MELLWEQLQMQTFIFYATEDGTKEIPEDKLYWIQAAEEADRKGVDIISIL